MVDETGLDELKVDETAVDEIAVDEPGPHLFFLHFRATQGSYFLWNVFRFKIQWLKIQFQF